MLVYRISQTKYAHQLSAPGIAARWNSEGLKMIYTAGSVALACLENLAHRSGAAITAGNFSIAIIDINDNLETESISNADLMNINPQWNQVDHYPITQKLGKDWLNSGKSAVLKVPSAIIDLEFNYLINPNHRDFAKIKIVEISRFTFDPRLKARP